MQQLIGDTLTIFMGLFAIMNPIANAPIFLALTEDDTPETRRWVALHALLLSFTLIVAFVVGGKLIFNVFGVSLSAFQIVGGVLISMIGYNMLQGQQSLVQHPSSGEQDSDVSAELNVATTPLSGRSAPAWSSRGRGERCQSALELNNHWDPA